MSDKVNSFTRKAFLAGASWAARYREEHGVNPDEEDADQDNEWADLWDGLAAHSGLAPTDGTPA
jgi:hypothetical protein